MSELKSSFEADLERAGINIVKKIIPSFLDAALNRHGLSISLSRNALIKKSYETLYNRFSAPVSDGGNPTLRKRLINLYHHQYGRDYYRNTMATRTGVGGVLLEEARDAGILHARSNIGIPAQIDSPMTRYMRLMERMQNFRIGFERGEYRGASSHNDDQFAFGVDTGVHDDFEYLRRSERAFAEHKAKRRYTYWHDNLSDYNRERFDLIQHFGGGSEGIHMADDYLQKQANISMSAAEARGHVSKKRRLQRLQKEYPAWSNFFKDSKMQSKDIHKIEKRLSALGNIPIIGKGLATRPIGTVAGAAYTALVWGLNKSDRANQSVVSWQNTANFYGKPTPEFTKAAMLAGYKDPAGVAKLYGALTARFGDANIGVQALGNAMAGLPPIARMKIASKFGLDADAVAAIDIMSGNRHLAVDKSRKTNAYKNMVEVRKEYGFSSGGSFTDMANSVWWSVPGMTSAQARDMRDFKYAERGVTNGFYENIESVYDAVNDAAESAKRHEANGSVDKTTPASNQQSRNISISVNGVSVQANDPKEFMQKMYEASQGVYDLNTIESFDGRMVA